MTELIFILDRSGSMSGLEKDTIGGFNSLIDKQRREENKALVTTVLFDSEYDIIHDRIALDRVPPMTEKEYFVRGCTALLDAVGETVEHIAKIHKYSRSEDVPEKTLFVITTDGMENSSHRYTAEQVKKMVKQKQEENGWEFLFLGANIDAIEAADSIGIGAERAANFCCDEAGTELNYRVLSKAVSSMCCGCGVNDDWKAEIDEDFMMRS